MREYYLKIELAFQTFQIRRDWSFSSRVLIAMKSIPRQL